MGCPCRTPSPRRLICPPVAFQAGRAQAPRGLVLRLWRSSRRPGRRFSRVAYDRWRSVAVSSVWIVSDPIMHDACILPRAHGPEERSAFALLDTLRLTG
ncbi:MAG: hypothetical protein [Microviridae sp.]|nr:MAG: hypothetical protein [Microviridae sp.]